MVDVGWDRLPLVPLKVVLDNLPFKDALSAMSVCRNWRNALLVYEGYKEHMDLKVKHTEKNLFLARLFKKHLRRLHVCIDCTGEELDKFFNIVLPEFYDSQKLTELTFIGPSYLEYNYTIPATKLNRIITEGLVFKNSHCLTKLVILGCEMDVANDNDRYMHEQVEYYTAPLSWNSQPSPADSILSRTNTSLMNYSTLRVIAMEYSQLSTEALEILSNLPVFNFLHLTVTMRTRLLPIDWQRLTDCYPNGIDLAFNIVAVPSRRFGDLMDNVLVEGLSLVSLKVFYCRTFHSPLLSHVVRVYKNSLRELVWVDSPQGAIETRRVIAHPHRSEDIEACNINPFILLCWQCVNLRRLVIHGYWIWQYDVLGFVRLRKTLEQLELSSIFIKHRHVLSDSHMRADAVIRVWHGDRPYKLDETVIQEINEYTDFPWEPTSWSKLPPALRHRATRPQRAQYVLQETLLTDLAENFSLTSWAGNSNDVYTRTLQTLCNTSNILKKHRCQGFHIMNSDLFYPIEWESWMLYYKPNYEKLHYTEAYMHHTWNSYGALEKPRPDTLLGKLYMEYCPRIYDLIRRNM